MASVLAAAMTAVIAGGVLVGWMLGGGGWTRPIAGLPPMMPLTAVMLLSAAVGVAAAASPRGRPLSRALQRAGGLLAGAIATWVLAEYALGRALGIDRLLFPEALARLEYPLPGRPAPDTAVALLVVAAALLVLRPWRRAGVLVANLLAVMVLLLALTSVLGFVFGAHPLYHPAPEPPALGMAPHTAVGLVLIGIGLICAVPERGLMAVVLSSGVGGFVARRLLVPALLGPIAVVFVVLAAEARWFDPQVAGALLAAGGLAIGMAIVLGVAHTLNVLEAKRQQAEDALRQSEARHRLLIEQASDGIFIADNDGRFVDVNRAGCEMLGYTRDELVGKYIADVIPERERPRLAAMKERMFTSGGPDVAEWLARHKDGRYFPIEISQKVLPDGRWQAMARDIRARKEVEQAERRAHQAEQTLRLELERIDAANAAVSQAVARLPVTGLRAVLHEVALQARQLADAESAAVGIGDDPARPFEPFVGVGVSWPEPPRPEGVLAEVAARGEVVRLADVRTHPNYRAPALHPSVRSFLGVPIKYQDRQVGNLFLGNKRGAAEFCDRDLRNVVMLTDRAGLAIETARLYEALALERAWLVSVLDQMPEAMILLDRNGGVALLNRAAAALAVEQNGAATWDFVTPDGAAVPADESPLARPGSRGPARELAVRTRDGRIVPVLVSAASVCRGAETIGACLVLQDISTLKELERLRKEWTAVVAHDLRQPVTAVRLAAELLSVRLRENGSPELIGPLKRIASASSRLTRMIEDLLDASRIEARRLQLRRERVEAHRAVRDALARVEDAAAAGHPIRFVGAGPPSVLWVDPARLEQVLGNLLSNAAKYGDPGSEIVVEVRTGGPWIELVVSNRGPGIPPEELPRLFERYARTRTAEASAIHGVGLGLYICKGLVEAHGGRIFVESSPGQQTKVHVLLPRPQPEAVASEHPIH